MTRFVVDAPAVIELLESGLPVRAHHQLVAPALLKSQVLSRLHASVARGDVPVVDGRATLNRFDSLRVRYLSDRVSRATAWRISDQLGLQETYLAEYLAVAQLQADALIALDPALAAAAEGLVPLATLDALNG